jgi:hypothetical protein
MTRRIIQMAAIDTIGDIIPNVKIETVILEKSKITLYLYIDEYIYTSGRGTWITDTAYTNMLDIKVRQACRKGGRKIVKNHTISSSDYLERNIKNITSRRETMQKIVYKMVLDNFDYSNITDLSFTAHTAITKEKFMASDGRDANFNVADLKSLKGKRNKVLVMKAGNVMTETLGFFLEESFYTGPRTQLANGRWVTGRTRTEESEFLITRSIPNIRVADYRDIYDDGFLRGISLSPPQSVKNNLPYGTTLTSLSKLNTTRDKSGNLKFFFTLDYASAYGRESLFGGLFRKMTDSIKDRVLLNSAIKSLVISRTRVDAEGSSSDEAEEILVISGEKEGDRGFTQYDARAGAIREEELQFQYGSLLLRSFSGVDRGFQGIKNGEYQYKMRADVVDGAYKFMDFQLKDINDATKSMQEYFIELEKENPQTGFGPNYNEQLDVYSENFISNQNLRYSFENLPYIRTLVSISENISFLADDLPSYEEKKILNTLRAMLSPRTGTRSQAQDAFSFLMRIRDNLLYVMALLDSEAPFVNTSPNGQLSRGVPRGGVFTIEREFPELVDASSPFNRGLAYLSYTEILDAEMPDGLKKVGGPDLMRRFENESQKFFNSINADFSIQSTSGGSVNSEAQSTAYSFMTPTSLRLGDTAYMINSNKSSPISGELTVENLSSGDEKLNYKKAFAKLTSGQLQGEFTSFLDVKPLSDLEFEITADQGKINYDNDTKTAIENFSLSIEANADELYNPFESSVVKVVAPESLSKGEADVELKKAKLDNLPDKARFTNINDKNVEGISVQQSSLDKEYSSPSANKLKSETMLDIIDLQGNASSLSKRSFDSLPNHIKAMFSSGADLGPELKEILDDINGGYMDKYNLIIGSIVEVEVLTGYNRDSENEVLVGSPNFVPLTAAEYSRNAGRTILCRLKFYDEPSVGFERSNMAQIYNSLFTVSVPVSAATDNILQDQLNNAATADEIGTILQTSPVQTSPNSCTEVQKEKTVQQIFGLTRPTR